MNRVFLESHNVKNLFKGFGQFNYHLIKAISNKQFNFEIILHDPNNTLKQFGKKFSYKTYHSLSRYIPITKKVNLWHSLNQNTKIEPFNTKIPYILTVHDVNFIEESKCNGSLKKYRQRFNTKLQKADAITYISKFTKTAVHQQFSVPKVPEHIIYNGNPAELYCGKAQKKHKAIASPYIFSIGEFREKKNFHTLLDMLLKLPEYKLVIAGNTKFSYFQQFIDEVRFKKLSNRVKIMGLISEDLKHFHLKNCTAFAFPSLREGFGLPPIEAMQYGKPVFLSTCSSLPEIGGNASYYWDNFDPDSMVDVFTRGMQDYYENIKIRKKQIQQQAGLYSWSKTADQYLDLYKSFLD